MLSVDFYFAVFAIQGWFIRILVDFATKTGGEIRYHKYFQDMLNRGMGGTIGSL